MIKAVEAIIDRGEPIIELSLVISANISHNSHFYTNKIEPIARITFSDLIFE